jgi:hypothetical protein
MTSCQCSLQSNSNYQYLSSLMDSPPLLIPRLSCPHVHRKCQFPRGPFLYVARRAQDRADRLAEAGAVGGNLVLLTVRLGAAYMIPKRAFPSPEEIDAFIASAQTKLSHAASLHNPPPPPAFGG